jgi:hypothetical protein
MILPAFRRHSTHVQEERSQLEGLMNSWILVGLFGLAEVFFLLLIPKALFSGVVPINPLSWFGYSELGEAMVERDRFPAAYWFVVVLMTALALLLGAVIYAIALGVAG